MGCRASRPSDPADAKQRTTSEQRSQARKAARAENKEYQAKMEFLGRVPLLKRLPKDHYPLLASAVVVQEFARGSDVIRQGEQGDEFFVIRSGEATVHVKQESGESQKVATLRAGDYFGENALLRDEERSATITAATPLSTFKIRRDKFQEFGLQDKLHFANRRAVGAGGHCAVKAKPPTDKTEAEFKLIARAIRENENLLTLTTFDDARLKSFIDAMWKEEVPAGQDIITEGDLNADFFYVVQEGTLDILVSELDGGARGQSLEARMEGKVVSTVFAGGSFGELALLYYVPRAATVRAKTRSVLWVIDRQNFKSILMKVSDSTLRDYVRYLDGVTMLESLLSEEKKTLARALLEMHFTKGEVIVRQGDPGNTFYILYDGEVKIIKDGKQVNSLSASSARGTAQYFGEGALLDSETRGATVKVTSEVAKILVVDRDAFNMLLGPLKDIIESYRTFGSNRASQSMTVAQAGAMLRAPAAVSSGAPTRILRRDLVRVGVLGCGGFGLVELYEHRLTHATFAMKGLSKGYILKTGMQDSVMSEKNILMMTNSDFIIKLYETYNSSQVLYFLMEPALGGELYATYNRKGFHGSTRHCMFYSAGVVLAFEHLHERRIIYRDLKPENLLLTDKGHLKLTDMGLAKFVIGKSFTTCGTPDYFAPEMIASSGHTSAVDWWTLGVLIFELMAGHPPFESAYPMQTYAKVTRGISKVPFPAVVKGHVADLVRQLLKNDPSERLPMRSGGVDNLKAHKWYEGFSWEKMADLSAEVPFKPTVKSKKDVANFHARKEDMPKQIDYRDPGTGWDKDFATA